MSYTKLLTSTAALLLVAACGTTPKQEGAAVTDASQQSAPVPGTAEDFNINAGDRVLFEYNKHNLTPEGQRTLDHQAAWLMTYPGVTTKIEGHCDPRGTEKYNMVLGEKRAHAAKDYLTALGIAADRLSTISYGKSQAQGTDEASWAQDRKAISVISIPAAQ